MNEPRFEMTDAEQRVADDWRDASEREAQKCHEQNGHAKVKPSDGIVLDPKAPLDSAQHVREHLFDYQQKSTLIRWRGDFYSWSASGQYQLVTDETMRSVVYKFLENCEVDGASPFNPNKSKVDNILDALRAITTLNDGVEPPAWIGGKSGLSPHGLFPCRNGVVDLATGRLHRPNPDFFSVNVTAVEYQANPKPPATWTGFLNQLWPDDQQSIDALQTWFGLCLTSYTRLQKALMLIGPKRSGKGTIARTQAAILGQANVAAPTLSSLQTNFGLSALLNKPLAIIADARLSGRADQAAVVERLLSVIGEDLVVVDRKHRDPVSVRLPTRVMLLSNELPRLGDASGALSSRFIVLRLTRSFLGAEDVALEDKLQGELPGILRWAMEGWRRVHAARKLIQPDSGQELVSELEAIVSPIGAFLAERTERDPGSEVDIDELFSVWQEWCKAENREHVGHKTAFGREVRAAMPDLRVRQPRIGGSRCRTYVGLRLR